MPAPYAKKKSAAASSKALPCKYFQAGRCRNAKCPYLHVKGTTAGGAAARVAGGPTLSSSAAGASDPDTQKTRSVLQTMLRLFFEKQQQKVLVNGTLDLSHLASFPDLEAVRGSVDLNTKSFCDALCATLSEIVSPFPQVLVLASNDMTSLTHLARALREYGLQESIVALSLADNRIASMEVLSQLRGLSNLRALVLRGNPVAEEPAYRETAHKRLPLLQTLDGADMRDAALELQWPVFAASAASLAGRPGLSPSAAARVFSINYTAEQLSVLDFLQQRLFSPLEGSEGEGNVIDAVSDVYARQCHFSLTLSCAEAALSCLSADGKAPASGGEEGRGVDRAAVREVVRLRMRQRETNHNLVVATPAVVTSCVASGRANVCAQLGNTLYPQTFRVRHRLHGTASVVIMDNSGYGPAAVGNMKEPIVAVTVHGLMEWTYVAPPTSTGGSHSSGKKAAAVSEGPVLARRNFARTLTLVARTDGMALPWAVNNDMVTLLPPRPSAATIQGLEALAASPDAESFEDGVLLSPATDARRALLLSRRHTVPPYVVSAIAAYCSTDAQLDAILRDLTGVPDGNYAEAAALADNDPIAAIFLCRLHNRFGVAPAPVGLQLLQQHSYDWERLSSAAAAL